MAVTFEVNALHFATTPIIGVHSIPSVDELIQRCAGRIYFNHNGHIENNGRMRTTISLLIST